MHLCACTETESVATVGKSRSKIKKKNKIRLERDLAKKNIEDKKKMISKFPDYSDLRAFRDEEIPPEPPALPMVADRNITLSKSELKILSKSHKFATSKEAYMAEIEKGFRMAGMEE